MGVNVFASWEFLSFQGGFVSPFLSDSQYSTVHFTWLVSLTSSSMISMSSNNQEIDTESEINDALPMCVSGDPW